MGHSFLYRTHVIENSPEWRLAKEWADEENIEVYGAGKIHCERCNTDSPGGYWHHHHLHYAHLGYEFAHLEDIAVLCPRCHRVADYRRKRMMPIDWVLRKNKKPVFQPAPIPEEQIIVEYAPPPDPETLELLERLKDL